jgi:sRNA-binding carbon storage regulator CsrA
VAVQGGRVRIGVVAPDSVRVHREEFRRNPEGSAVSLANGHAATAAPTVKS